MNKGYWEGVEMSLKTQRKFFEKEIIKIESKLEQIEVLKKMEENDESSLVSDQPMCYSKAYS